MEVLLIVSLDGTSRSGLTRRKFTRDVHTDILVSNPPSTPAEIIITSGESPKRLDIFLAQRAPMLSRSALQRLILEGRIRVNGKAVRPSTKIKSGEVISLDIPRPQPLTLLPEAIPLEILMEDSDILVLNKPAGLVVHPAPGNWSGTLINALLYHFASSGGTLSTIGGNERPGLVHRLDKDTSGVMVIAKTDLAHRALAAQFKQHTVAREYEALVWGVPRKGHGLIDLAIGRDSKERKKFSPRTVRPKASATEYRVTQRYGKLAAHVALFPRTGRTHQLRVHLSAIGHPILGDSIYGGRMVRRIHGIEVPRVMLHARLLGFVHPVSGQYTEFAVGCPSDMRLVHQALERHAESVKERKHTSRS